MTATRERKDDHLDVVLQMRRDTPANAFDGILLQHCALPELDAAEIDLSVRFLGWPLGLPFLISSMTGGPARAARINAHLAEAAQELRIPLGVGSQRVALEGEGAAGIDGSLRRLAPDSPLLANLGGAQLATPGGIALALRAADMIDANAVIVHLNPLQEAIQPHGDRNWRGVLTAIASLVREVERPVIVKEVGHGISGPVALKLMEAGVAAVDVAGRGGTDWAAVEAARAGPEGQAVAEAFHGWGIPTPVALAELARACPSLPLIGSGGIRHGVDAAKALCLGASLVGQAGPVLEAALVSTEAVIAHFTRLSEQLRIACFCVGAPDVAALRGVRLLGVNGAVSLHDV